MLCINAFITKNGNQENRNLHLLFSVVTSRSRRPKNQKHKKVREKQDSSSSSTLKNASQKHSLSKQGLAVSQRGGCSAERASGVIVIEQPAVEAAPVEEVAAGQYLTNLLLLLELVETNRAAALHIISIRAQAPELSYVQPYNFARPPCILCWILGSLLLIMNTVAMAMAYHLKDNPIFEQNQRHQRMGEENQREESISNIWHAVEPHLHILVYHSFNRISDGG